MVEAFQDEPLRLGGRSPGRAFAERHGFRMVLENARRDLALPVPERRLGPLAGEALERAAGYTTLTWTSAWPDTYVEDRLRFGRRMSTDAPIGESSMEEEYWDESRLRSLEALQEAQGRTVLTSVAERGCDGPPGGLHPDRRSRGHAREGLPARHARPPRAPRAPAGPAREGGEPARPDGTLARTGWSSPTTP